MTVTEFRAIWNRLTSHGWLDLEEALLLVSSAEQTRGDIVEIGCYQGRSTLLLASMETDGTWNRQLHCVDPWEDKFSRPALSGDECHKRFLENTAEFVYPPIHVYRMRIEDWTPVPAGFVYCDGDHTYQGTLNQVRKALACNPQIIAVHDVNDAGGGRDVKRACLELLGPWKERVHHLAIWQARTAR